jgi:hypothetical protein
MSGSSIDTQTHRRVNPAQIDRALGSTENIYYLLDKLYCLNFVVFAEIDGAFDTARLGDALRAVQAEHPLLRARVALAQGRLWFKSIEAEEHPIPLEVGALRNWRIKLAAHLDKPFAGEAPLARFLWFGGARRCAAAMVFHHAIADGRSGADVFLEVLRRAGGEDLPFSYRPARVSAQDLDLVKLKGWVGGSIKKLGYWLSQGRSALKFAQQLPGYDMTARAERAIEVLNMSILPAKARALLAACRAHATTMQGALGAALLLALNSEFGSAHARHLGLNSLADLRGVLSGGLTHQDLGLYIATVTTVHEIPAKPDFWSLAADIAHQVRAALSSGDANLVHSIHSEQALYPPNVIGARMVQALVGLAPPSSMLTNVGRFDPVVLQNGARMRSLAFLVSPPAHQPVCVTVASFAEGMYLNLLYDRHKIAIEQARRIADSMTDYLDLATEG